MHSAATSSPSQVSQEESKSLFSKLKNKFSADIWKLIPVFALGFILWYFFQPQAVSDKAWLLFVIFVSNIVAIVLKPLPMGALSLVAIGVLTFSKTLTLSTILGGFSNDLIWLIVMACFLARSFIKTGLGRRIAFALVTKEELQKKFM